MTPYEVEKAFADYLSTNWTYTDIRLVNKDTQPTLPYIEAHFRPGEMFNIEINGVGQRAGVMMIDIYTELGVGVQEGGAYGGKLEALFWHKTLSSDVVCETELLPYTVDLGVDAEKQAYHHQTIIPFFVITEN